MFFQFVYAFLILLLVEGAVYETESKLKKALLENYDKDVLPLEEFKKPVKVGIGLALITIDAFRPECNELEGKFFMKLNWTDPRLIWDSSKHANIQTISSLKPSDIWTPDVTLYNGESEIVGSKSNKELLTLVLSNGQVLWVPYVKLRVKCYPKVNTSKFSGLKDQAFSADSGDLEHHDLVRWCNFKFGSWVFDATRFEISLMDSDPKIDLTDYTVDPLNAWEVAKNIAVVDSKTYPCCPEPYTSANFIIKLRKLFL